MVFTWYNVSFFFFLADKKINSTIRRTAERLLLIIVSWLVVSSSTTHNIKMMLKMLIIYSNGKNKTHRLRLLVNTSTEIDYLKTGGILQYVYKNISNQ